MARSILIHLACHPVLAQISVAECSISLLSSLCRLCWPHARVNGGGGRGGGGGGGGHADTYSSPSAAAPLVELQAAALEAGKSAADPLAAQIGAANTLVRRSDGSLAAFNTDCSAAVSAIEGGLRQVPRLPSPAPAGLLAQRRAPLNASPGWCTTGGGVAEPLSGFRGCCLVSPSIS